MLDQRASFLLAAGASVGPTSAVPGPPTAVVTVPTAVADGIPAEPQQPSGVAGAAAIGNISQAYTEAATEPKAPTARLPVFAGPAEQVEPAAGHALPAEDAELSNKAVMAALEAADVHGHEETAVVSGEAAPSFSLLM